jgi:transcriptional regulator with XRE-family HTH domain
MSDPDHLYAEFVRAWRDGQAPEADAYLDRAAPADQNALAERIETFVMVAPSVELVPERVAEIEALPAFLRAAAIPEDASAQWRARLRAARDAAGLSLAELGSAFASAFGLGGREARATSMLQQLESGDLPASGVSERAAARLAELLGQAADALRPPPPAAAMFRAEDAAADELGDVLARAAAAMSAPVGHEWDELDDLLRRPG